MVETGCRVVRCSDVTIQISVFIITVIDIYTIVFGSHIILTMYSIHLDQDCLSCKFRCIEFEHFVCDICTMQRIPALVIGDSTLGSLGESDCASSGIRPFRMNLGSVVQALSCDSQSTLLDVRPGSKWFFRDVKHMPRCSVPRGTYPDVVNQLVLFKISIEADGDRVECPESWDWKAMMSVSLMEAMRTNQSVRSLDLEVDFLKRPHLTAIEDSLKENDTLQRFSVRVDCATPCPRRAVSEACRRIMERNMSSRELDIGPPDAFPKLMRFEVEEELTYSGAMPRRAWSSQWRINLGGTVERAIERNRQAWIIAKQLGQVSRSSMHGCRHLGDVGFRRDLLLFFLEEGCQPPPQLLHILKGLPNL